ncbi:MAG: pirin family protein [Steroidobacteraceae bacterium]
MSGVEFGSAFHDAPRFAGAAVAASARAGARRVALLASGRRHGDITRLITPWTIGELTAPFVFLDYAQVAPESHLHGIQPHPGIATLTIVLNGAVSFEDTTGQRGEVRAGGFAWMRAAHAAWHGGGSASAEPLRVFQLWVQLPSSPDDMPAASEDVAPHEVEADGPARVILGQSGEARSRIRNAPEDINCFHVCLRDGERWRYAAPAGHNVTWLAVDRGGLQLQESERVYWEQIAVFGDSRGLIEARAAGDASFLVGSAPRLPRPLALDEDSIAAPFAAIVQDEPQSAPRDTRLRAQGGR